MKLQLESNSLRANNIWLLTICLKRSYHLLTHASEISSNWIEAISTFTRVVLQQVHCCKFKLQIPDKHTAWIATVSVIFSTLPLTDVVMRKQEQIAQGKVSTLKQPGHSLLTQSSHASNSRQFLFWSSFVMVFLSKFKKSICFSSLHLLGNWLHV